MHFKKIRKQVMVCATAFILACGFMTATPKAAEQNDEEEESSFQFTVGNEVVPVTHDGIADRELEDFEDIFTPKELGKIKGEEIIARVDVDFNYNSVAFTEAEKAMIQSVLPGYKVIRFFDVKLNKIVVNDKTVLTATNDYHRLRYNITMEDFVLNPMLGKHYYLVSCNNGIVQLLPNPNTHPLQVDAMVNQFGTYALVVEQ